MKEGSFSSPFSSIKRPPLAQELLDLAFKRSFRPKSTKGNGLVKTARIREIGRVACMADIISNRLKEVVRSFPSFDSLHPFYRELADVLVGVDELRLSLSRLDWAGGMVSRIGKQYIRKLSKSEDFDEMERLRKAAMGRISSVVKSISSDLELVRSASEKLRSVPNIQVGVPTVVISGMPNTGKSTLVRKISTGKPEVASYPFTTKSLLVGHFYLKGGALRVQVIDTPGLLDRPLSERNEIELQAILALKLLAWCMIFLIDPTETCGYSIESQLSLLDEISREFSDVRRVIALNKADIWQQFVDSVKKCKEGLKRRGFSFFEISAERGIGLNTLTRVLSIEILELYNRSRKRGQVHRPSDGMVGASG